MEINNKTHLRQSIRSRYSSSSNQEIIAAILKCQAGQKIDNCAYLIEILKQRNVKVQPKLEEEFYRIEQVHMKVQRCVRYFAEPTEGWRIDRFAQGHQLCTKVFNKSQVMMRYQGVIDINIYNLCAMVYEVGLFNQWVPFCKQASDVKTVGAASKIAYLKFDLPFISSREGYFYGQGVDRNDLNKKIIIYCEGITGNKAWEKRYNLNLEKAAKSVELDLKFLVVQIEMIKPGRYKIRAYGHLDIKMSFIPEFVLGYFSKKIGSFLMERLIKTANNIKGTEWQKRIAANSDGFYSWLKEKIVCFQAQLQNPKI